MQLESLSSLIYSIIEWHLGSNAADGEKLLNSLILLSFFTNILYTNSYPAGSLLI